MYNINLLMTFYFVTYNYSTYATVDAYYLLLFQTDITILVIIYYLIGSTSLDVI